MPQKTEKNREKQAETVIGAICSPEPEPKTVQTLKEVRTQEVMTQTMPLVMKKEVMTQTISLTDIATQTEPIPVITRAELQTGKPVQPVIPPVVNKPILGTQVKQTLNHQEKTVKALYKHACHTCHKQFSSEMYLQKHYASEHRTVKSENVKTASENQSEHKTVKKQKKPSENTPVQTQRSEMKQIVNSRETDQPSKTKFLEEIQAIVRNQKKQHQDTDMDINYIKKRKQIKEERQANLKPCSQNCHWTNCYKKSKFCPEHHQFIPTSPRPQPSWTDRKETTVHQQQPVSNGDEKTVKKKPESKPQKKQKETLVMGNMKSENVKAPLPGRDKKKMVKARQIRIIKDARRQNLSTVNNTVKEELQETASERGETEIEYIHEKFNKQLKMCSLASKPELFKIAVYINGSKQIALNDTGCTTFAITPKIHI